MLTKLMNKNFTNGRRGHKIRYIVLHHNAGNLSIQQIYDTWQTRQASAHYQVQSDGQCAMLVREEDTAWHANNMTANLESIGIEHADDNTSPWHISDAAIEAGAHLVATLCSKYGLGRPAWGVNVFPHSHFSATACPGSLQDSQRDQYMSRAQAYYDELTNSTPAPVSTTAAQPAQSFGGTYRCNVTALNVRNAPNLQGGIVARYSVGQTVVLDNWYTIADGYVWGRYTGYSGATRYIAVGKATGKPEPNDYLIKI